MHTEVFIDRHQNVWLPTNLNVTILLGTLLTTYVGAGWIVAAQQSKEHD